MEVTKVLLKVIKIIAVIILIIALLIGILYLYADNKPLVHKGFQEKIEIGGAIEAEYLKTGRYEVLKTTEKAEDPIKNIRFIIRQN